MKVETPQILWNAEGEKGINAALYSVSMVQSGIVERATSTAPMQYGNVLATAGNSNAIHLWNLSFPTTTTMSTTQQQAASAAAAASEQRMYQRHERVKKNSPSSKKGGTSSSNNNNNSSNPNATKIDYLCSLTRHEGAVNALAFSPDGLHLATAGERSGIIVWSVPVSKRGNGNGRHYWSTVQHENDLVVRMIGGGDGGVTDLSWSADSKRFMAGTIDSAVIVLEDEQYSAATNRSNNDSSSGNSNSAHQQQQLKDSQWKVVYRSKEHTHFVQGVSYDPLGVYMASMSNDRSVRIYPRKTPPKSKKKVLRPAAATNSKQRTTNSMPSLPPADHANMVNTLLTDSKLEVSKSKQIKARKIVVDKETGAIQKQNLFCDESTLESFFRRLSWTTDGAFLVTPAVLWHDHYSQGAATNNKNGDGSGTASPTPPSYATCLYARHHFDQPYKVFAGLEKPSLVVRPNPVLFTLPENAKVQVATKENASSSPKNATTSSSSSSSSPASLPYRSIFCVLTWDSVLIYDTHHDKPLSIVRGLHYSHYADATWSADGHTLLVCSSDGYVSILRFAPGELGQVYVPSPAPTTTESSATMAATNVAATTGTTPKNNITASTVVRPPAVVDCKPLPPCEPGSEAVLEEPPTKRSKTCDDRSSSGGIAAAQPAALPMSESGPNKRPVSAVDDDHEDVGKAVDKLSLENNEVAGQKNNNDKPKKKKRVQPILLSSA